MLVTIGRHRLNLFNVTKFDHAERIVHFTNADQVELTEGEADALRIYWDDHAEKPYARKKNDTDSDPGREFELGGTST